MDEADGQDNIKSKFLGISRSIFGMLIGIIFVLLIQLKFVDFLFPLVIVLSSFGILISKAMHEFLGMPFSLYIVLIPAISAIFPAYFGWLLGSKKIDERVLGIAFLFIYLLLAAIAGVFAYTVVS